MVIPVRARTVMTLRDEEENGDDRRPGGEALI
jgi:hypothetical protein